MSHVTSGSTHTAHRRRRGPSRKVFLGLCGLLLLAGGLPLPAQSQIVDLDIDTDNNDLFSPPARSEEEEAMEDDPALPGRIVIRNDEDHDGDLVPDFADGFDLHGNLSESDDSNAGQSFVPLVVELSEEVDFEAARIRVYYDVSDPAATTVYEEEVAFYEPAPGHLRLWNQPGATRRLAAPVFEGGNFVPPGEYHAEQLGFGRGRRTATWYVEGIATSRRLADQEIYVEVDPDGNGPASPGGDVVRLTVVDLQFITRGTEDELVAQSFTYNSVPAPTIHARVEECRADDDGRVTLEVHGTVRDEVSGMVADPCLQLRSLTISPEGQQVENVRLENHAPTDESVWQPYGFEADFAAAVSLRTQGPGDYRVTLRTSRNLAGVAAELGLSVHFDGREAYCVEEAETDPGTLAPTLVRLAAPDGTFVEGEDRIQAFGTSWPLVYRDLGDGPFLYASDAGDRAAVFLPALYATAIDATIPIARIRHDFGVWVVRGGQLTGNGQLAKKNGLMVRHDDVSGYLGKVTNYIKEKRLEGGVLKYLYVPKTGGAGYLDKTLDTEIKWRFVNRDDGFLTFGSKSEFLADLAHRHKVVSTAKSVTFGFASPGTYNSAKWFGPTTVKSGVKACDAIADIFTNQSQYSMACLLGALYTVENGTCHALGTGTASARLGQYPLANAWDVMKRITLPNNASNNHPNNGRWIPGDFGYIDNTDPYASGLLTGENVIYVGGSFDTSFAAFKKSADFWGHIGGQKVKKVKKLEAWMTVVEGWSFGTNMVLLEHRDRLKY